MILPRTILFDLDGTLVDTAPDLAGAMNCVLAHFGRPAVSVAAVRDMVGHGARATIAKGLDLTGGGDMAMVEAGVPLFLEYYEAHIADSSAPWPGVEQALDALAAAGCRLGICTNKPTALSRALISALGWEGRFGANVGGDVLAVRKPDPAHVLEALTLLGGQAGDAAFVGDSIVDVSAARNAGLPVVAVSFGYSDRPAAELGADVLIDHFDHLLPALHGFVGMAQ